MSLRSCLLSILVLLAFACGGGGRTTYPGPETITLEVATPAEGAVVNQTTFTLYGKVSVATAVVAVNDQLVTVNGEGIFHADLQLKVGENLATVQAWSAEAAKKGRGSSLLPLGTASAKLVRRVIYQDPTLTLSVSSPAEGAHFTAPTIAVSGLASDASAAVTMNASPLAVAGNGQFSGTATLQPGLNALVFLATASGDRSATLTRTVIYDPPTPPAPGALGVSIQSPAEGLLTNATTVNVTGTVTDPSATLTVNGQSATPNASGAWALTLSPSEGPLTINAQAAKGALSAQDSRHITVDRTPPVITLSRAVPALTNFSTYNLTGTVDDPTAVLTLQGKVIPLDAQGRFSTPCTLLEGANTLGLQATDWAGNAGRLDARTTLDSIAPVVTLESPVEGLQTAVRETLVKGRVDDPTARLMISGQVVPLDASGAFEWTCKPSKEGAQLLVILASDPAGNTGHATRSITFDWTPPALAWIDPTPAEGALVGTPRVPVAAGVSEVCSIDLNGNALAVEAVPLGSKVTAPYQTLAEPAVSEGQVTLTLSAKDAVGNTSAIQRRLEVGLTTPVIQVDQPALKSDGSFTTSAASLTLAGQVTAPAFVAPLSLKANGSALALDSANRFTLPLTLAEGDNPIRLVASNRFGQSSTRDLIIRRYQTSFGVEIQWPLDGMSLPDKSVVVRGRVLRPVASLILNGLAVPVDANLAFTAPVPLEKGLNLIQALGTDEVGNTGSAQVKVYSVPPSSATYRWDLPLSGGRSTRRTVSISGQADLPGIASLEINGVPMALSGVGASGRFQGDVTVDAKGRSLLSLEAHTVAGETLREQREVVYEPALPRMRLISPDSARPGQRIPVQIKAESGTTLVSAEIQFAGALLGRVSSPFPALEALVPQDAAIGSRIPVDAVGTDDQGETVSLRAYVQVYAGGALLQRVADDRTGLAIEGATVAIEGGESGLSDASGRVALQTAIPDNWIKVSKTGCTSVWRSAGLKQAGVEATLSARLTPKLDPQASLSFAGGALVLNASGNWSATPLSSHGLPAALPLGWSPVSAWWIEGGAFPITANLKAPAELPQDARVVWAQWDESEHEWMPLTASLAVTGLTSLPVPAQGGYALLLADPQPTTPPEALVGEPLVGFAEENWRSDLTCTTTATPQTMSTVEAIRGARMEPRMTLAFKGGQAVPSGTPLQADVVESYTLLDQRVIEPESFSQDLWAHRWSLLVRDGLPVLESATDALLVRLLLRMSRTFGDEELVEGRLWVGFYHDQLRLAETGSGLLGAGGGQVSNGGITVQVPAGALTGTALLTVTPDSGDLAALWGSLGVPGALKASFQVDVVGTLTQGLQISLDTLDAPETAKPLLIQRRAIHGERVNLVVGFLQKDGSLWKVVPSQPLLEGGAFSVFLPEQAYSWVSGSTTDGASQPLADVQVRGDLLPALSGSTGAFAVPMLAAGTLRGERSDLGLAGTLSVTPPATGVVLPLATVPFRILQVLPVESSVVESGEVPQVSTSSPMAADSITAARLYRASDSLEIALRRSLSQDARTLLLVPESPLESGQSYRLALDGLRSVQGETAPLFERRFSTTAQVKGDVDLTRFQLNYPDEQLNVTVTVPEGAVPAWSIVSVEATDMGAYGQGVMPPSGGLSFPMKANLGERLHVIVQTREGRSVSGTIGRYVAPDGRTTLGADGGRVEGPNGLAVVVPEGALAKSVELRAVPNSEQPQPAAEALNTGEQFVGALELRSKEPIEFSKPPVLELPASSVPQGVVVKAQDAALTYGNGPVAVFQKVVTTLPDGTEDFSYLLMDTAQLSSDGQKLRTLGGLRLPDAVSGTLVQSRAVSLVKRQAPLAVATTKALAGKNAAVIQGEAAAGYDYEPYSVGFFTMYIPQAVYEPQYYYHSGTVYRNWNGLGSCNGTASSTCYGPLPYGEVHRYNGTVGLDKARMGRLARGRLLTAADGNGKYLNVGGSDAGAIPGQSWIALFAVDPRTGETSIDEGAPSAESLGLPWTRRDHSIAITSKGGNPFDPTLTAPRIKARLVDASGTARNIFTVGESFKLKIETEAGSQPVVRGKITGSMEQDFGALPTEIPMTFTSDGTWDVDILGWTAKPVQGTAKVSAIVTLPSQLGESLDGKPKVLYTDPANGDKDLDPSTMIQITFSEPVHGATSSAFIVNVNGAPVSFRVVSNAREVTNAATEVQDVLLIPNQRLLMGAKVTVNVRNLIDRDGEVMDLTSWAFTVCGAGVVGSLPGVGTFTQMVGHKGKLYAVEDVGAGYWFDFKGYHYDEGLRKQGVRVIDVSDPSSPKKGSIFGQYRSWDPPTPEFLNLFLTKGPFAKSSITGLRVVPGVSIGGKARDVLLVSTRPWLDSEIIAAGEEAEDNIVRFRQSALWAFDITGDEDSLELSMGNKIPKLLMGASQGTTSPNWVKGFGGTGGMLGSIKLRSGMTLWDADKWKASWDADMATLHDWTIRYRTSGHNVGYFPDPGSVVASNGFYSPGGTEYSVLSAVISEDTQGRPIAYAAMGYGSGLLALIDGKVGEPESMATFMSGGPKGMDGRVHDLSSAVNNEHADVVEVMKGNWQAPSGSEQGTLLLVGTLSTSGGKFWVLKPDLTNLSNPSATQYAYAAIPGTIKRIIPDPAKMLVGVESNGQVYVYDIKTLLPKDGKPALITPIYSFAADGGWTLTDGLVYASDSIGATRTLSGRNLAEYSIYLEDPGVTEVSDIFQGSNMLLPDLAVELRSLKGATIFPRISLSLCDWLLISEGMLGGVPAKNFNASKPYQTLRLTLGRSSGVPPGTYLLRVWGGDTAGNGFLGQSPMDIEAGMPLVLRITRDDAQ